MNYKKILVILLVFFIINSWLCFAILIRSHEYNSNSYDMIYSTINDINIEIEDLQYSSNLHETLISLTEIKQNSLMAVKLISSIDPKSNELAIGDLLGYIYFFIDDIESKKINKQLLESITNDLTEVNTVFSKISTNNLNDRKEYFNLLVRELNKNVNKYPDNQILSNYFNRKIH